MKSKALVFAGLLCSLAVGCGGAPDTTDTNDGYEITTDETAKVGESQQALDVGSTVGSGSTTSIQECIPKQSCHFECTDPVDENDIYHCKLVCVNVCTRF